ASRTREQEPGGERPQADRGGEPEAHAPAAAPFLQRPAPVPALVHGSRRLRGLLASVRLAGLNPPGAMRIRRAGRSASPPEPRAAANSAPESRWHRRRRPSRLPGMETAALLPPRSEMLRALVRRDAAYEGVFVAAVRST